MQGRFEEARPMLEDALASLKPDPGPDTVDALTYLALLHTFVGNGSEADRLSAAALSLGQALDLPDSKLARLFISRGIAHALANRGAQASANLYEAVRLAERAEDATAAGGALSNLTDVLVVSDPSAAVDAGRAAVAHCRRLGHRDQLGTAAGNLIQALILTGRWDEASRVYTDGLERDQLSGDLVFEYPGLLLSVFAGHEAAVTATLQKVERTPPSDDPQDTSERELSLAAAAAYRGRHVEALQHAQRAIASAETFGPSVDSIRWGWPIAAEAALALGDDAEVTRLLAWLDSHQPGHIPRLLRAERLRIGARKLAADNQPEAESAFDRALTALRAFGSPYHLAVGLVDHAEYLSATGLTQRAQEAVVEAETITARLGARPLSERARRISPNTAERVQERCTELGVKA
jgi:tetratricopeptide (TPR) repeat protein